MIGTAARSWIRAQNRRRQLVAAGAAAALYALVFLVLWLFSLLSPFGLAESAGPVVVDLGGNQPGAVPLGLPIAPERPATTPPAPPAPALQQGQSAAPAPPPATRAPAGSVTTSPPSASPTSPSARSIPVPSETSKQAPAAPPGPAQSAPQPASAAPAAPSSRTFSSSPGPAGAVPGAAAPGLPGGTGSVTFRGSEMGNALATTFGASSGTVGRNLYVPIYLYMPLPSVIDDTLYQRIPSEANGYFPAAARKESFRSYYGKSGSAWRLKAPVPIGERAPLWLMLEDAGYDPVNADFKAGLSLSPVVLEFAIGPVSGSSASLVQLKLVSSSGNKEIDDAVMYGFRQASFFNRNNYAVSGRFTYGFNAGPSQ